MDGEEGAGLGPRDGGRGSLHLVTDVVQLPVGEHLSSGAGQPSGERHAVGRQELQPDLVETDRVPEQVDHRLGVLRRRQVQGGDQARVGGHGGVHIGLAGEGGMHGAASGVVQTSRQG